MSVIHIRRTLDSETLSLPELRPFLGKQIDIIVLVNEAVEASHTASRRGPAV
jgi:hypothetical protein